MKLILVISLQQEVLFIYTETYCAILTFDLENADAKDYNNINQSLKSVKLTNNPTGKDGTKLELPNNVYFGSFPKDDYDNIDSFVEDLKYEIEVQFKQCELNTKYSLVVGTNWIGMIEDI